jgi:hypothetical protein
MKKMRRRQTKEEKARCINLRGFSASPAVMEMNSGPTILHDKYHQPYCQGSGIYSGYSREGALNEARNKSEKASGVSRSEVLDKGALQTGLLARQREMAIFDLPGFSSR